MPSKKEIFLDGLASTQLKFYDIFRTQSQQKKDIYIKKKEQNFNQHEFTLSIMKKPLTMDFCTKKKRKKGGAVSIPFNPKN